VLEHAVVVSSAVFLRPVKADIHQWSHRQSSRGRSGPIVKAERDMMPGQQGEYFVGVPARIAELDGMAPALGQAVQKSGQAIDIDSPSRRQLIENRPEGATERDRA